MSVIDEEDYHGVGETLEGTDEYDDYLSAYQKLEEIENAEETSKADIVALILAEWRNTNGGFAPPTQEN